MILTKNTDYSKHNKETNKNEKHHGTILIPGHYLNDTTIPYHISKTRQRQQQHHQQQHHQQQQHRQQQHHQQQQ